MEEPKLIDIDKVLETKNPKLRKWLPGFVVRYIKRIVHQDEINAFIAKHREKKNADFCSEVVRYFNITFEVENIERIPKNGKTVIAMNHPLGGMDALILVTALQGHREDIKFIVNDILMNLESLKDLFVGVNKVRKNRSSGSARQEIVELFQSDKAVCIFPAGLVSRKTKGVVMDKEWKKTFVTYSRKYDRTVVPLYIDGKLSNFFYRLSNFRKFLGIKMNIEMLYLSNELFKQRNKHIKFVVGEPIEQSLLESDKKDRAVADIIKDRVYSMRTN